MGGGENDDPGAADSQRSIAMGANRDWKTDPLPWLIFTLTLAAYLISMPKSVALEDDSVFILSGYFNGVSHPPGYPLMTLIIHLFTQIPLGDIAARAHASSAFFSALTCVTLFLLCRHAGLGRVPAFLTSLAFALSATFWSQSIITEVYSLNLFLNLVLLLAALELARAGRAADPGAAVMRNWLLVFAVALGLALSNHWPLTLLALPGYLLIIARPLLASISRLLWLWPALAIPFGFYLYLYFNNQSLPLINFSGEFTGFGEFIDFVTRKHYSVVDQNETAGWLDKLYFSIDLGRQFGRELNLLLLPALYGGYVLLRDPESRVVGLALLWILIANSLLLVLLINFDYGALFSLVFRVYPLLSIATLFVLAAYGCAAAMRASWLPAAKRYIVGALGVCLAINLFFSLPQNYRHDYAWGEEYAARILAATPSGAVLFSDGDVELGLLSYYHHVEGLRPDLRLYSSSALLLNNRLFDYRLDDKRAFLESYQRRNPDLAVFAMPNLYDLAYRQRGVFYYRLGNPDGEPVLAIDSRDVDTIVDWSDGADQRDPWTRIATERLRQDAISILVSTRKTASDPAILAYIGASLQRLVQTQSDLLHLLIAQIDGEQRIEPAAYQPLLETLDRTALPSKQMDSHFVYLQERVRQPEQERQFVIEAHRRACLNWNSLKNYYCRVDPT